MKKLITILVTLVSLITQGQGKITATDEFSVVGQIQNEIRFTIEDLVKLKSVEIPDIEITNHLGVKKGVATKLSGIPIKTILATIQFKADNPKLLSRFYLVFVASDDYKVVYSWNEIFNTPTGENTYILVSKDGKKINEMEDRIVVVTKTDLTTGRRFIKGLRKIIIEEVP